MECWIAHTANAVAITTANAVAITKAAAETVDSAVKKVPIVTLSIT